MKALALVVAFWALVALGVGWSRAFSSALEDDNVMLALPLALVPAIGISAFLWFMFREFFG